MKKSKTVGIDLGTTNSVVAIMDETDSRIICYANKNNQRTIPSVVYKDPKKGEIIVGKRAFDRRGLHPEPVVSIKRKMGTEELTRLTDEDVVPEVVSSHILAECKKLMEGQLNEGRKGDDHEYVVDRVVATVPAYFGLNAKEATKKAAERAGLKVEALLQEPTSAAMFYSWKNNIEDANFMVYDLGGGTFDVSIIQKIAGEAFVVGMAGNNFLGGDNFDMKLAWDILEKLKDDNPDYCLDLDTINNPDDRLRFTKLILAAEGAKKELSENDQYFLSRPSLFQDKNGLNVAVDTEVQRECFEKLIEGLVDSTLEQCDIALEQAKAASGIGIEDIDYILLVGGSSKIPLVQQKVKNKYCPPMQPHARCEEPTICEPDMAVGFGAALCAASYGTIFYNDNPNIAVALDSFALTMSGNVAVSGSVFSPEGTNDFEGYTVRIRNEGIGLNHQTTVAQEDQKYLFRFNELPIKKEDADSNELTLLDRAGAEIMNFTLKTGKTAPPPPPSVLSHDIKLDILDPQSLTVKRIVILPKGTVLPAQKEEVRHTNEYTRKRLSLILYEDNSILKSIDLSFETEVAPGTPVAFTLDVSANSVITVVGEVAGHPFSAEILPPKPKVPTPEECELLKKEFAENITMLPAGKKLLYETKAKNIILNLDEGCRNNEAAKIIEFYGVLHGLNLEIKEMIIDPGLKPPLEEFETLADQCIELRSLVVHMGKDPGGTEAEILELKQAGQTHYSKKEKERYEKCYERLLSIGKRLYAMIESVAPTPSTSPYEKATKIQNQLEEEANKIDQELTKYKGENKENISEECAQIRGKLSAIRGTIHPTMNEDDYNEYIKGARLIYREMEILGGKIGRTRIDEFVPY